MDKQTKWPQLENEAEIVERAKTDDQAFEILYNHYFQRIYGYVFKRCGNHETTEDLVSVTFMKVFSNLKTYQHEGFSFGAWIYKIATNNLIDHYRKQGKRQYVNIDDLPEPKSGEKSPEESAESLQNRELVQRIIQDLPKRYQEILQLRFFAEMSNQEIAETLGITANNSRVLVYRALKVFQKKYEKYEIQLQEKMK